MQLLKSIIYKSPYKFTQFELTNYLLKNAYKWELLPIEQTVLFQLAACYNPRKEYIFPKQKTLALKINSTVSKVSKAIQELIEKDLIITKYQGGQNHYKFTSKILTEVIKNN